MKSGSKRHIRYRPVNRNKQAEEPALRYGPVFTGCPALELAIDRLYEADEPGREERFWGLIRGLNYALQMQTHVLVPAEMEPAGRRDQLSWAKAPVPPERAGGMRYWLLKAPKGQKMLPVFTYWKEADGNPVTVGLPIIELPLRQAMEEALAREDIGGLVVNPWGRSATLDKSILRGLLYARSVEDGPGDAEAGEGCRLAAEGRWEEAAALYQAAADQNSLEGMRLLANCYNGGRGVPRDRRKALSLWKRAAAGGSILSQLALGDSYAQGTARTPGDPGRALMAYRKARAMGELALDINSWPLVCLRLAQNEAGCTDPEQAARLLAEAIHGLALLCGEEGGEVLRPELEEAAALLTEYAKEKYAGSGALAGVLRQLAAELNTEALHLS